MPRTAAQYPSTTSPTSASTAASSVVATLVASRALSVWSNPPALDAQGSGRAPVAGGTDAGGAAGGVGAPRGGAGGGGGADAAACRRPFRTPRFVARTPRPFLRTAAFACVSVSSTPV